MTSTTTQPTTPATYPRCTRCGHSWHGLECRKNGTAAPSECGCKTSWEDK